MVGFLDGYFVILDAPNSLFKISNLNDGLLYDGFDAATRTFASDPLVAMVIDHRERFLSYRLHPPSTRARHATLDDAAKASLDRQWADERSLVSWSPKTYNIGLDCLARVLRVYPFDFSWTTT